MELSYRLCVNIYINFKPRNVKLMGQLLVILILVLLYPLLYTCRNRDNNKDEVNLANFKVYFNSILPYGRPTFVVITVQIMPTKSKITLRLHTKSYILVYCNIGKVKIKMPPPFQKTTSISSELKRLNVRSSDNVDYDTGYFAAVSATFWNIEDEYMILKGEGRKSFTKTFKIKVDKSKSGPRLKMLWCPDPSEPRSVAVSRDLFVRTVYENSGGKMINTKLKWSLMDLLGENTYLNKETSRNTAYFERYTLRVFSKYELWRNLLMIFVKGQYEGYTFAARCYIFVVMGQVEAVIRGGITREASFFKKLIMDGTMSRDYAKRASELQFSKYYWNCQSNTDRGNKNCIKNMSTLSTFTIGPNLLKVNHEYVFILNVADDANPNRRSRMVQTVKIVKVDVLQVVIYCVFNCAMGMFNPQSKVRLKGKCLNCDDAELTYNWYVSNQLTLTKPDLTVYIRTVENKALVRLIIETADGRSGSQTKVYRKNLGPKSGSCTVRPTTGTEALTAFYPCCKNFRTSNPPVEYLYYAGDVLLTSCYDCSCETYLPVVSQIKVLICDDFLACCSYLIPVHVDPLQNVTLQSNYLNSDPHNVPIQVKEENDLRYLQVIQSMASRIGNVEAANELIRAIEDSKTCNRAALGKLANLTQTLAMQLKPINPQAHLMLTKVLLLLNNNFACLYSHDLAKLLIEQPFINVTQGCVTVYSIMNRLSNQAPRPANSIYEKYNKALKDGTLIQTTVDQLMDEINTFSDEDAKYRSTLWLNSMWQTERLYRFLGYARDHGLQPNEIGDILTEGVALEFQCFFIEPFRTYYIETSDSIHKVKFSPDLLQELKEKPDDWICIKVVSTIRELNWWYPEEKRPSTVLLSVRVFHTYDKFRVEVPLTKSVISFTTIIGKYKPSKTTRDISEYFDSPSLRSEGEEDHHDQIDPEEEIANGQYINTLEQGVLNYMQDILMYRIVLEELNMLAVSFTKSTHKLHIKLTMEEPPLFSEVSASTCSIPGNLTRKTVLIRNNCNEVKRAYMAVRVWGEKPPLKGTKTPVPIGPAEFAFIFQMRSCDHWVYSNLPDEQHWGHDSCKPSIIVNISRGMRCTCQILGTYTSYVYTVPAIVVIVDPITDVKINGVVLACYSTIISGLLLWLLWLYLYNSIPPSKTVVCEMIDMEGKSKRDVHDLLVEVKTGGRDNARTTASVKLTFLTAQRQELQFTLMQDPEHPVLQQNTTYILWLRTRDIRIPTKIAVSHDNNGRFPNWYLQRIEVSDVQTQETQVFVVRRWVKNKILVLTSSLIFRRGDVRSVGNWYRRFRVCMEIEFTNWYLFQPIIGTWRETNEHPSMSRFKRTCVFISKLVIVFCIVACYTGPTTVESLQRDRWSYIRFDDWLLLSVICYVVCIFVQILFEWMIFHYA